MTPSPAVEVQQVAPCGLAAVWLGLLRQLGLRDIVDARVGSECELSHGAVIEAMVLNRLLSPRPLSRVEQWAEEAGLAALTGLDPSKLNDDRLGRALDAVCAVIPSVQAALTARAVQAFKVEVTDVNCDTTTMFLEGYYEDSELAARGHSKDYRPDHKQVKIALVTAEDGQVPLTHITLAGNTGDVTTVPVALMELRRQLPTQPVVVSGDAAMWSQANMDEVAKAGGIFVGPIAMNESVQKWVRTTALSIKVQVQLIRSQQPVQYEAAIAGRFAVAGVADAGTRIVVCDARRANEQQAERQGAITRYEAALSELAGKLNGPRLKKRGAVDTRLANLQKRHGLAAKYIHAAVDEVEGRFAVAG